jgi:hypothetical protein
LGRSGVCHSCLYLYRFFGWRKIGGEKTLRGGRYAGAGRGISTCIKAPDSLVWVLTALVSVAKNNFRRLRGIRYGRYAQCIPIRVVIKPCSKPVEATEKL